MAAHEDWNLKGYYGPLVNAQANAANLPNASGTFDIHDVSDPHNPVKITGDIGAIGMRYALYFIANYGKGGHTYRVISHRTLDGTRPLHSFVVHL